MTRIRGLVERGQFPPGSKLPPERTLAAELKAGRPAIREAIKVLSVLGMLESRPGSGTFVKAIEPIPDVSPSLAEVGIPELGVLDLMEVRALIEPRAAWLAATHASEQQLLEIETARQRFEMHDRDWKLVAKLDYALHAAIFHGANRPALLLIYEFLMSRIRETGAMKLRFPHDVDLMRRGHQAVVEAILNRQADAAERAMIEHLHSLSADLIPEANG